MRISDWSSDVCSSDLNRKLYTRGNWRSPYRYHAFGAGARIQPGYYAQRYVIADPRRYRLPVARGPNRWVRHYDDVLLVNTRTGRVVDVIQIGRASCRERVGQYV